VVGIHDLHVWQIDGARVVATAHVSAVQSTDVKLLLHNIHTVMHRRGLHASTIQIELVPVATISEVNEAAVPLLLMCSDTLCSDSSCKDNVCCIQSSE
jgi:hypothetical protein